LAGALDLLKPSFFKSCSGGQLPPILSESELTTAVIDRRYSRVSTEQGALTFEFVTKRRGAPAIPDSRPSRPVKAKNPLRPPISPYLIRIFFGLRISPQKNPVNSLNPV
jgi:hypothetical protein